MSVCSALDTADWMDMRLVDITVPAGLTSSPGEAGKRGDCGQVGELGSESRRLPLWVSRLEANAVRDNLKN